MSLRPADAAPKASERIEVVDGVAMYRISNVDRLDPFLMTVVSNSDLWMFVSSTGGLTAGRVDAADSLFPYETDDRLHAGAGRVGPITVLRVRSHEGTVLWEPFTADGSHHRRSLLKSLLGDAVIFEEEHLDLGLTFRYRWAPSDRFGWVRTASLEAGPGGSPVTVDVLDGVLSVMPWGVGVVLQQQMSNLANAYRRGELVAPGIGIYTLESQIVDRPEPAEALRATTVWATGLEATEQTVDPEAVTRARRGRSFHPATLRTGRPGAFLLRASVDLQPGESRRWHIVGDVAQSHSDVARLVHVLSSSVDVAGQIDDDIRASSAELRTILAGADGMQRTASPKTDAHHLANTLFNVMRGGTFLAGYRVEAARFRAFVQDRNRSVAGRHADWLADLPESLDAEDLRSRAAQPGDPNLLRLAHEYLPLGFSRRHGDPSRPWNSFTIRVRDDQGAPLLRYQGNWRDIFQNWEALCRNFPGFLPSIIAKFVNASTADGFNPYRITSEGIDWEIPEPDNPWSGIGYWGDHQIVYLLRLLESQEAHRPGWLSAELARSAYAYADVPYRIVPYDRLVENPKATVDYDPAWEAAIAQRVAARGADGRLVAGPDGEVVHVTFLEKLLVPALAKLSNLVPGGGIWMNTQRPEWNDANNALVGYGLSMVTLAYLRRYVALLASVVDDLDRDLPVSSGVVDWAEAVTAALESNETILDGPDSAHRARLLHELGAAYDAYRSAVYDTGVSGPRPLAPALVRRLCRSALRYLDAAIRDARRPDGLYHAYNLIRFSADRTSVDVEHLPEMLEGQVAVLSSGLLDTDESADLLTAMYDSALYREDVDSFMLYPARPRPSFMDRNRVPGEAVDANPLLAALRDAGSEAVLVGDVNGDYHFNADFRNARDLEAALEGFTDPALQGLAAEHRTATLELFEEVFGHHGFTGRSSAMYAFEGIGSVYWHMVAKLLLAVQEQILSGAGSASPTGLRELVDLYFRVRGGLGFNKSASEYGAFPTDPYSHTPAHTGAQQPGMTGQVKEELLTRWAELGLTVADGSVRFTPVLLRAAEFLTEPGELAFIDATGRSLELALDPGQAALTLCQVPVVLHADDGDPRIVVTRDTGSEDRAGLSVEPATAREVFGRTGRIQRLDVFIPSASFHPQR